MAGPFRDLIYLVRYVKGRQDFLTPPPMTLRYSCLENPMDGGAWQAAVHGVAKSRTWPRDFTSLPMTPMCIRGHCAAQPLLYIMSKVPSGTKILSTWSIPENYKNSFWIPPLLLLTSLLPRTSSIPPKQPTRMSRLNLSVTLPEKTFLTSRLSQVTPTVHSHSTLYFTFLTPRALPITSSTSVFLGLYSRL